MMAIPIKKAKVFADAYQLTIFVFERTKAYPKHMRPTLGRKIEEASINLMIALRSATSAPKEMRDLKRGLLLKASEYLDELRILTQLSRDMYVLPDSGYSEISSLTSEIGKQVGGFIKYESGNIIQNSI